MKIIARTFIKNCFMEIIRYQFSVIIIDLARKLLINVAKMPE